MRRVCLISYHEIGLKGRNRSSFERRLLDNIRASLSSQPVRGVYRAAGRIVVELNGLAGHESILEHIASVPGVHAVALAVQTGQSEAEYLAAVDLVVDEAQPLGSIRVDSRRSNTDFPITSMDLNVAIGAHVQRRTGAPVNLSNPDTTIGVLMNQGDAFVWSRRVLGVGGLPVGSAGKVMSLLSSGIDSPVATWRIIARGTTALGVHFSGRPQIDDASERAVVRIGEVLARTGGLGRIYIVPFGDIQKRVALLSPPDLRVLLYRKLMMAVSQRIAEPEHARALVTGESLGQVASQTLENIRAVDDGVSLPVFRPLIASHKLEIMQQARSIDTYELSIESASDCCTLFMPRNPETHARLEVVRAAWEALPTDELVDEAMSLLEWVDFPSFSYRPPRCWPTPAGKRGERIVLSELSVSGRS